MTRHESIRMLDKTSRALGALVRVEKFGRNRRLLVFPGDLEWDITPSADGMLEVRRRVRSVGVTIGEDVMEPEYVVAVMRAIATGEAMPEPTPA